ncbi:MAG: ABC transporter ATP-binding protein, partial [Calditrichaeota bacterium]
MVQVQGLIKSFGTFYALRGIDLELPRGLFLSIFGPNGAGKSTFIRILSTLSRPSSGKILIDGKPLLENAEEIRQRLGVIAHATYLYDELTAMENLQFYARLYNLPNPTDRIHQALSEVGLEARKHDLVRTFSRGMQQRLSIARAMLHEPDILLL